MKGFKGEIKKPFKKNEKNVIDRFYKKVSVSVISPCWLWEGSFNNKGYGWFNRAGKVELAHRASWILHYGEIPPGMSVLHKCDVRNCVNPDHLFIGTPKQNMQDCSNKGRLSINLPFYKGEQHGMAKLTDDSVREIRVRYAQGESSRKLGKEFGVSQTTVLDAVNKILWKHVI